MSSATRIELVPILLGVLFSMAMIELVSVA